MLGRRVLGTAVALAAALSLAACVPSPAPPTPTPTQLTEAEAYAAAEDAFRAYIDAQNAVVVEDPATFEPVFALTTGRQNAFDREQYSTWHAEGWTQSGSTRVLWVEPNPEESSSESVRLQACLDTSQITVTDAEGMMQRVEDGLDIAVWTSVVVRDETDDLWRVEVNALPEGSEPCQEL